MFRALGSICLKASELHSSVRRLLVVAREQHNEVSRVLNGLVHLLDEVRSNRNIVVLNEDPVPLLSENVKTSRAIAATEPRRLRKKSYCSLGPLRMAANNHASSPRVRCTSCT